MEEVKQGERQASNFAWILVFILLLLLIATSGLAFYLFGQLQAFKSMSQENQTAEEEVSLVPTITPITTAAPTQKPQPTDINKEYVFPITDDNGETAGEIKITLVDYQRINEVIVQGKRATAVSGREFLIVNLKLNSNNDAITNVNTKDYIRLSVNNQENWVAPDIHNDPVELESNSDKFTRVGFAINESDANLRLQINEPSGEKDILEL